MNDTIGYVALALMAALVVLAFVTACACVVLWVKFGREADDVRRKLWRHTLLGDEVKGR